MISSKKDRKKVILTIIITVLLLLIFGAALFVYVKEPVSIFSVDEPIKQDPLPADTILTAKQIEEDRNMLIGYVEDIHPYFITDADDKDYVMAREKFIVETSDDMTAAEFNVCASKYLCFFEDGHTRISFEEQYRLPIYCRYYEGKLYASDNVSFDGYVFVDSGSKCITQLGNVEIADVFEKIDELFPAENEIMRNLNYGRYSIGKNLLTYSGAVIPGNKISVVYSDGTKEEYEFEDVYAMQNEINNEACNEVAAINRYTYDNGIFIIDFNECNDDEELNEIASALGKAIDEGCSKVIIDARSNGGGNSSACDRLLRTMGMQPPGYGSVIRFSKEAKQQRGYIRKSGSIRMNPSSKAKKNPNVDLIVLSDGNTFSSANMLLVVVRDGKLGRIVGEPSSNKPSHYGDIIYFSLPNSHLYGCISHKKFTRPDSINVENIMLPDVTCMPEDAMQKALSLFEN